MLERTKTDPRYLKRLLFSDDATCHTSGFVNSKNVRIWRTAQPHVCRQKERVSPNFNVWSTMTERQIVGPLLFLRAYN